MQKKKKKRMYFSLKKVGEIKLYLKNTYQKNIRFLLRMRQMTLEKNSF